MERCRCRPPLRGRFLTWRLADDCRRGVTILVPGWLIRTLATADLNNDAYGDVIIGAPGRVWVINGSPSLSGLIDLSSTPANVTISGAGIGDVIATGDVTGDGVDDLVLGAPESDGLHRGAVYLVYGSNSASLPPTINLPNGANALFLGWIRATKRVRA